MANKEREVICKNVFRSDDPKTLKEEYLNKWIELINTQEKYKDVKL